MYYTFKSTEKVHRLNQKYQRALCHKNGKTLWSRGNPKEDTAAFAIQGEPLPAGVGHNGRELLGLLRVVINSSFVDLPIHPGQAPTYTKVLKDMLGPVSGLWLGLIDC